MTSRDGTLHPTAVLVVALQFLPLLYIVDLRHLGMLVGGMCVLTLLSVRRNERALILVYLRLFAVGMGFLLLLYGIEPVTFAPSAALLRDAAYPGLRLAGIFSLALLFHARVRKIDVFGACLSAGVPLPAIFLLFRSIWVLEDIRIRATDITTSLSLRGIDTGKRWSRIRLLAASSTSMFNSLVIEMHESSIAIASKGITRNGPHSVFVKRKFGRRDAAFAVIVPLMMYISIFTD